MRVQIIAHESGVPNTVDPLGGSYFVEALTDEIERQRGIFLLQTLQHRFWIGIVRDVDELLVKTVTDVSASAAALGVTVGMTGRQALEKFL